MPYDTTANGLALSLSTVSGVGRVYIEERHLRDRDRVHSLLTIDPANESERSPILGWFIHRESVSEEWETSGSSYATEAWTLRGFAGFEDRDSATERSFNALVDRVWTKFRTLKSVGSLDVLSAASKTMPDTREIPGYLCLSAEVALTAYERFGIPTVTPLPSHEASVAGAREDYEDTASQLGGYIAAVSGYGQIITGHRLVTSRENVIDDFTVEADGLPEGYRDIRAWQIFRGEDVENAGIGLRVESQTAWRLQAVRQWSDDIESGFRFQMHLDDARAKFRGLQNLGNVRNPTMAASTPLQVREVGAKMLGGQLVHFADCEVGIEELVHA